LGAAYYVYNCLLGKPRSFVWKHSYWGPSFNNQEIEKTLNQIKLKYVVLDNASQKAAELISKGRIVGWFQGRMEAGARALGNRSILADPRFASMKDILNAQVKHRELFRPFAPSILEEKVGEYFEHDEPASFMERVYLVKPDKRKLIPAVVHVDGTGRLQTINEKSNHKYWQLIKEFENITGLPIILNTSFNINGEPIVCKPIEAIRCFYSTGMDDLILDNFWLTKK
jgi:carbamoyltransferase